MKRANANLDRDGLPPLPAALTPHSLRRTFATILYTLGTPLPVVKAEMGHETTALGLDVYGQAERLDDAELAALAAWRNGVEDGRALVSITARRASKRRRKRRTGLNGVRARREGVGA